LLETLEPQAGQKAAPSLIWKLQLAQGLVFDTSFSCIVCIGFAGIVGATLWEILLAAHPSFAIGESLGIMFGAPQVGQPLNRDERRHSE
jgi:hypothetical protein